MNNELIKKLKYLRLTTLLTQWDQYLKQAAKGNYSHNRLLTHIINEEYNIKQQNSTKLRLKRASMSEELRIESYPFSRQPKLNKKKILAHYDSFTYIDNTENIIWIGPTGCGKTGLATSFLIQAIEKGYTGKYILFADLIHQLYQSEADRTHEKLIKRFAAFDCLLIDEIGYIEVEPNQVGQFFTLMQKRHKRKPTLITSNLGFSEWNSLLKNEHLSAALIDRLTENSHVINMKRCVSLRAKPK